MKFKASPKNIYLVSYDISLTRSRNKIARLLEEYGYERIQFSVFTGLAAPHRNKKLWDKLGKLVDNQTYPDDRIMSLKIAKKAFQEMKIIGNFAADREYLLGEKNTEFI